MLYVLQIVLEEETEKYNYFSTLIQDQENEYIFQNTCFCFQFTYGSPVQYEVNTFSLRNNAQECFSYDTI